MSIRVLLCALCWICLCGADALGADKRIDSRGQRYRKCWAVVVGINYQNLTGAAQHEVPPLGTAERDAQAVYDALLANYGFTAETSRLLLGPQAGREQVRELFGEGFLADASRVSPEDCVLFYFAGHGNRRETVAKHEAYVGLLYPSDVRVLPGKGCDTVSCLRLGEILQCLDELCPARHKLVVLDSCHSGEVFNIKSHRSAGVNREFKSGLFRLPSFQAVASARSGQKAADKDESGEHSPFTRALLDAFEKGPALAQIRPFSASELFAYLPARMAEMPGVNQDPRGGWIAGEGEYYFFPKQLKLPDGVATLAIPVAPAESETTPAIRGMLDNAPLDGAKTAATPWGDWRSWGLVATLLLAGVAGVQYWRISRLRNGPAERHASKHSVADGGPASLVPLPALPRLRLWNAEDKQEALCLLGPAADLGRAMTCEFAFPRAPQGMSNRHARVAYDSASEQFVVTDLGSSNGSFVDETRILQQTVLRDGATLRCGSGFSLGCRVLKSDVGALALELSWRDTAGRAAVRCILAPAHRLRVEDLFSAEPSHAAKLTGFVVREQGGFVWVRHDQAGQEVRSALTDGMQWKVGAATLVVGLQQ